MKQQYYAVNKRTTGVKSKERNKNNLVCDFLKYHEQNIS